MRSKTQTAAVSASAISDDSAFIELMPISRTVADTALVFVAAREALHALKILVSSVEEATAPE
eukprot:2906114-Prymnesium_polylepis.1